jgi:hypothetical protein
LGEVCSHAGKCRKWIHIKDTVAGMRSNHDNAGESWSIKTERIRKHTHLDTLSLMGKWLYIHRFKIPKGTSPCPGRWPNHSSTEGKVSFSTISEDRKVAVSYLERVPIKCKPSEKLAHCNMFLYNDESMRLYCTYKMAHYI